MVVVLDFLWGMLVQMGNVLGVQLLNFAVLWQLLPIYTTWFATLFITKGKEYEDEANRFLNGFAVLWVGFQLGEYIIQNFFTDPLIIWKLFFVILLFVYAVFIMRLVLQGKKITKYIARIGEISAINVAAMLLIQDILIITDITQFFQMLLAFIIIYATIDLIMTLLTKYLWKRIGKPITKEIPAAVPAPAPTTAPARPPRYERITTYPPRRPVTPQARTPISRPVPPAYRRAVPPARTPTIPPPITIKKPVKPLKP